MFLCFLLLVQHLVLTRRRIPYPRPHRNHISATTYPDMPVKAVDCTRERMRDEAHALGLEGKLKGMAGIAIPHICAVKLQDFHTEFEQMLKAPISRKCKEEKSVTCSRAARQDKFSCNSCEV